MCQTFINMGKTGKRFVQRETTAWFLWVWVACLITDPHAEWKLALRGGYKTFFLGTTVMMLVHEAAFVKPSEHEDDDDVHVFEFHWMVGFQDLLTTSCTYVCVYI